MKVFNLTDAPVAYKNKTIGPYGAEDMDIDFLPDRDLALQKAGILAFGYLPVGWVKPEAKPEPALVQRRTGVKAVPPDEVEWAKKVAAEDDKADAKMKKKKE